jgi:hypothetical protein
MTSLERLFLTVLVLVLLSGCVVSHARRVPGVNYAPADAAAIEVLYQEPTRPYEVVGFVSVDIGSGVSDAAIERRFRTEAASLGANAVIIEAMPIHGFITTVQGKGKAIKWK